jgi:acetolactate synthase-1/2/3 large subunit
MGEISGGELFARGLAAEGIEFLFGLPSPEIDPLLAQLAAHEIGRASCRERVYRAV